jgi:hypothetical protein
MSVMRSPAVLKAREDVAGIHRPEGIFLAGGRGLRQGLRLPPLAIADTAPTVLHSLGLAVPGDFEGSVAVAAFTPESLAADPVRTGPPTEEPRAFPVQADDAEAAAEDEALIMERLKALGYL